MRKEQTIFIPMDEMAYIKKLLMTQPTNESECFGEDNHITNTADFGNGWEMDIKLCGIQYDEDCEDCTPWTEAVLFYNGIEIACTEPSDDYKGEWTLADFEGNEYVVFIKEEKMSEKI